MRFLLSRVTIKYCLKLDAPIEECIAEQCAIDIRIALPPQPKICRPNVLVTFKELDGVMDDEAQLSEGRFDSGRTICLAYHRGRTRPTWDCLPVQF